MRWIPFLIFAYLFVLAQSTLGKILTFDRLPIGPIGPDLLVLLAVFVGLNVRNLVDGMIACWLIGFMIDLTTAGGVGLATRIGPMAFGYCLSVWMVFALREAMFRDKALPQMLMAALFCLACHGFWITVQTLFAADGSWAVYGSLILQVIISAIYTAMLMPLINFLLTPCRGMIIATVAEKSRRGKTY